MPEVFHTRLHVVSSASKLTTPAGGRWRGELGRDSRQVRLLEHVRSPALAVRTGQRILEPLLLQVAADHLLREPLEHVEAEGFEIECLGRSRCGVIKRLSARKP